MKRLNMATRISSVLDVKHFIPAVGQGAIGVECLASRDDLLRLLSAIDDPSSRWCVEAERKMSIELGANCHFPVGGFAKFIGEDAFLRGVVGDPMGKKLIFHEERIPRYEGPEALGTLVGRGLIGKGAMKLLERI